MRIWAEDRALYIEVANTLYTSPLAEMIDVVAREAGIRCAIENAALNSLEQLQDILSREFTVPWPTVPDSEAGTFAPPSVEIQGHEVRLSYTTNTAPAAPTVRFVVNGLDERAL